MTSKKRPQVICHMMSSVDGKLDCDRYTLPYVNKSFDALSECYFTISLEYNAEAILIGRATVQKHYFPNTFHNEKYTPVTRFKIYKGNLESNRCTIVTDASGKIFFDKSDIDGENIIVLVGQQVSQEYLNNLEELHISYLFAGADGYNMEQALQTLYNDFNIKRLLLEGGGIINGSFLKAGLIDQLSLLVYPGIDGFRGAAAIFDYSDINDDAQAHRVKLQWLSTDTLDGGVVWIQYKLHWE